MKFSVGRDLALDIRKAIDQEIANSGPTWTVGSVATRLVARLREEDPELLAKWLDTVAITVVRMEILQITKSLKAEAKRVSERKGASIFTDAVTRHEQGEKHALGAWLGTYYIVNTDNQRRQLRDMDHDDLLFAANDYTNRAQMNAMQAAFLRALADRVGARTVGEVLGEQELARLWRSLT